MRTLACIFLSLGLIATARADAEQNVRCSEIGFSQAAEERDIERFASFIDPDARFIGNTVARGVAEIVEGWGGFFEPNGPAIIWRPQFVEVLEDGRLALTGGPYRVTTPTTDGREIEGWGTFNSVWRLTDEGQWRVVFDTGSPPTETPTDEARALIEEAVACD